MTDLENVIVLAGLQDIFGIVIALKRHQMLSTINEKFIYINKFEYANK